MNAVWRRAWKRFLRRPLLFHGVLLLVAGVGVQDLVRHTARLPGDDADTDQLVDCPMTLADRLARWPVTGGPGGRAGWSVVAFAHTGHPPLVGVSALWTRINGVPEEVCRLAILTYPDGTNNVDWRLGYRIRNVQSLSGLRITLTVRARGNASMRFESASIYIWDGLTVTAAAIPPVGPEWQDISVSRVLDQEASRLEVWIRLFYGKGMVRVESAGSGTGQDDDASALYIIPRLSAEPA